MMFRVNDGPLVRPRRQAAHQPADRRAAGARAAVQRRPPRRAGADAGAVPRLRPRPDAPGHPHREHAPRGLRAVRRQAAGDLPRDRTARSASRSSSSWSTAPTTARTAVMALLGDRRAELVKMGHRSEHQRLHPHGVQDSGPLAHGPAEPHAQRHQGRGDHAPHAVGLRAGARASCRAAAARRADLQRNRARRRPTRSTPCTTAACSSSAPATRCTRARSSARTAAPAIWWSTSCAARSSPTSAPPARTKTPRCGRCARCRSRRPRIHRGRRAGRDHAQDGAAPQDAAGETTANAPSGPRKPWRFSSQESNHQAIGDDATPFRTAMARRRHRSTR